MNINEMEKNLTGSYNEAFSTAVQYAMCKGYPNEKINETMTDLYDILLTAQEDGRPVEKVMGKDIGYFCRNYFGGYSLSDFLKSTAEFIFRCSIFVVIWEIIIAFASNDGFFAHMGGYMDAMPYLIGIAIAVAVNTISFFVVAPLTAKNKKAGDWSNIMLCVVLFGAIFLSTEFSPSVELNARVGIFLGIFLAYAVIFFTVRSVIRYKKYGTISDIYKKTFKENLTKSLQDTPMLEGVLKGWQIKYKRLLKKGKVTEETYIDVLKKDQKFRKVSNKLLIVFYICSFGWAAIDILIKNEVSNASIIGACVMVLFGLLAYSLFIKPMLRLEIICGNMLKECGKSRVSMPVFIDEKLRDMKK